MFNKSLVAVVIALAFVIIGWLTVQNSSAMPPAASSNTNVAERIRGLQETRLAAKEAKTENGFRSVLPRPKGYAALKEAQLAQEDARIGTLNLRVRVPTINGCKLYRNEPDC